MDDDGLPGGRKTRVAPRGALLVLVGVRKRSRIPFCAVCRGIPPGARTL